MKDLLKRILLLEGHENAQDADDVSKFATKEEIEEMYAIIMQTPPDLWDPQEASRQVHEIHNRILQRAKPTQENRR